MSITLKSRGGVSFQVDEAVAKYMTGVDCADREIPLPVKSKIVAKIIEYCKKHVDSAKPEDNSAAAAAAEELKAWESEFLRVDTATLCALFKAADYLKIQGLVDLTAKGIAALISGKTPQQIRETFNIKAPEPETDPEQIRRAVYVRGQVEIFVALLSGKTPQEIIETFKLKGAKPDLEQIRIFLKSHGREPNF